MRLLAFAAPLLAACSVSAIAQTVSDDPYVWLEEKDSARSLAWVEAHNARVVALMDRHLPHWQHLRKALNRLPVRREDWRY